MLSMRAWDRLVAQVILQNAIYACMGQTRLCVNYVKPQRKKEL